MLTMAPPPTEPATTTNVVPFRLPDEQDAALTPLGHAVLAVMRLGAYVDTLSERDRRELAPRIDELAGLLSASTAPTGDAYRAGWLLDRLATVWSRLSPTERASLLPALRDLAGHDVRPA